MPVVLMIDRADGSLHFDGKTIGRSTSLHELQHLRGGRFRVMSSHGSHCHCRVALTRQFQSEIGIAAGVNGTTVSGYTLWVHGDAPWDGYGSWDNWSEAVELANLAKLEAILKHSGIANEEKFPWGSVWAFYDQRSGGSSLGIRYSGT